MLVKLLGSDNVLTRLDVLGLKAVVKALVKADLWHCKQEESLLSNGDAQDLQGRVLDQEPIQDLNPDHAYAVMHALAEEGCSFTSVFCKMHSAADIEKHEVSSLMDLAVQNEQWTDVVNMTYCPKVEELGPSYLLQVGGDPKVDEGRLTGSATGLLSSLSVGFDVCLWLAARSGSYLQGRSRAAAKAPTCMCNMGLSWKLAEYRRCPCCFCDCSALSSTWFH